MPLLKTFSPPGSNRPGNRFFITLITVGIIALIVIWSKDKTAQAQSRVQTNSSPVVEKTSPASPPTQVRVMVRTNLPGKVLTNVISAFPATQTNLIRTNITGLGSFTPRPVQSIFEAQLSLARQGISAGSIDGVIGSQTRAALQAFQLREKLPLTGELDAATKTRLLLTAPAYGQFTVTTNELALLQPIGTSWLSKSKQNLLAYETLLEMVAEKSSCSPAFLKQLNSSIDWTNLMAGTTLRIPLIERPKPIESASFIRISLSGKNLKAFGVQTNLLAHFPCSIAQKVEKRPIGALSVEKIVTDPDYTFNPENFPESPEARSLKTKLIISPGPNNPVGTVWIGLNKPGYGIHGTPKPEEVGRTESHGCFRLANWNAEYLVQLVEIGTPIFVEP